LRPATCEAQNRGELDLFLASSRVLLHNIDRATAEHYADIFAALRAAGTPIPTNDIWIAASARQHALPVFSFDAHFTKVPGLRVGATMTDLSAG
jgi:tRNA(fMet)-specific endonuclease VapC